jgi:hypothetical protein
LIGKRYRVASLSWRYRRRSYKGDHGLPHSLSRLLEAS